MAIFVNSTFGRIRKSIGDDVSYVLNGQNIVRKKPAGYNDKNSLAQQQQRLKNSVKVDLGRFHKAFYYGQYPNKPTTWSDFNAWSSYNQGLVLVDAGLAVTFDAAAYVGALGGGQVSDVNTVADGGGVSTIAWNPNANGITGFSTDTVSVIAVNSVDFKPVKILHSAVTREGGTVDLQTPYVAGNHYYVVFKRADGQVSNTVLCAHI
jgi:hypothetical protein